MRQKPGMDPEIRWLLREESGGEREDEGKDEDEN